MHAAVVTSFDTPPSFIEYPEPAPAGPDDVLVEVLAVGLHPRVRSQAGGSHYTSTGELPLVPGIDGVGRTPDGSLRYFVLPDTTMGSLAERTVVDLRRSVVLPEGTDPVPIAAAMNPAMSSWVALRRRIDVSPGQRILVLGATGNAGRLAVQIARHFGAARVVAAGRNPDVLATLSELGADVTVSLRGDPTEVNRCLSEAAGDVDVVVDYLWGRPAADAMRALVVARLDGDQPLTWVQIGSVAGPEAAIPSAALRAVPLRVVGSGQGSVPTRDFLAELPALGAAIGAGTLAVDARAVPLAEVTAAWTDPDASGRTVLVP